MSENLPNLNTGPELSPESQEMLDAALGIHEQVRSVADQVEKTEDFSQPLDVDAHFDRYKNEISKPGNGRHRKAYNATEDKALSEGIATHTIAPYRPRHKEESRMVARHDPNESERPSRRRGAENRTSRDESRVVRQLSAEEMAAQQGIIPAEEEQSSETRVNADPADISGTTSHAIQFSSEIPTSERIREAQTDNQMTGQAEPAPRSQGPAHHVTVNGGDFSATGINIPVLRNTQAPEAAAPTPEPNQEPAGNNEPEGRASDYTEEDWPTDDEFGVVRHEPTGHTGGSDYDEPPLTRGSTLRPVSVEELGDSPDERKTPVVNPYGTGNQPQAGSFAGFDEDDEWPSEPVTATSAAAEPENNDPYGSLPDFLRPDDTPAPQPASANASQSPEHTAQPRTVQEILAEHDDWKIEADENGYHVTIPGDEHGRFSIAKVAADADGNPNLEGTMGLQKALELGELSGDQINNLSSDELAGYINAVAENAGYHIDPATGDILDARRRVRGNVRNGTEHASENVDIINTAIDNIDAAVADRSQREAALAASAPNVQVPSTVGPNQTIVTGLDTMTRAARHATPRSPMFPGMRNEFSRIGRKISGFSWQRFADRVDRMVTNGDPERRRKAIILLGAGTLATSALLANQLYVELNNGDSVTSDRSTTASASPTPGQTPEKPSPSASASAVESAKPSPSQTTPESTPTSGKTDEEKDKRAKQDEPKTGLTDTGIELPKNVDNDTESIKFSTKDGKMIVTAKVKQGGTTSNAIYDSLDVAGTKVNLANPNNVAQTYALVDQLAERGVDVNSIPVGQTFTLQIDPQTGQVKTM